MSISSWGVFLRLTLVSIFFLVLVRDRQLLRREQRDHFRAVRRQHDFFFDARSRYTVRRRAEGFHRENHSGLELVRILERIEPRDERPLVQAEPEAVAEVQTECGHLGLETDLGRLRK